jgi:hypothetical protein
MGFRKCVVPAGNLPLVESVASVELVPLRSVSELSDVVFVD